MPPISALLKLPGFDEQLGAQHSCRKVRVAARSSEVLQGLIGPVVTHRYRPGGFGDRPNPQAGGNDAAKKA